MEPNQQQVPPQQPQQPNMGQQMPPSGAPQGSGTGLAILAYIGILVIIPLVANKDNNPFVKYHTKQGLVLLIAGVITAVFSVVPIIGWIGGPLISLGLFILMIMGIINAAGGKTQELPLIGHFAEKFNF